VGGDQGGDALGGDNHAEQAHDLLGGLGVELAGGLVGQQHIGAAGQGAGDRHPLLLTAGQLAGALPAVLAEADDVQHEANPFLTLAGRHAGDTQRDPDVLGGGQDGDQAERLEDERDRGPAQPHPLPAGHGGHVLPGDLDPAVVGAVQAADDVEQGGLARTGPAPQGHQRGGRDRERDPAQGPGGGVAGAERPGHALGRHGRGGRAHPGSRSSGQTPM
jgi:hypothetical protein